MTNASHFINKTLQNIPFIHQMDKSQLQLGDSLFAFRTYHGSHTLKDFRINSGALLQILKRCRRQHPEEPPIHQRLKWQRSLFDIIKTQPQRHLQLHCMGQFNTFLAKPQVLLPIAWTQIHSPTTLRWFYLEQPHCTQHHPTATRSVLHLVIR